MADLFGRDLDELQRLSVDQLALIILPVLVTNYGGTVNWNNCRSEWRMRLQEADADRPTIQAFLRHAGAAWQWLRNETLLAPHYDQDPAAGWEMTTEAAATAQSRSLADARPNFQPLTRPHPVSLIVARPGIGRIRRPNVAMNIA